MGDKVTFNYEGQQRYGIIVGFVVVYNRTNAILRLSNGSYIKLFIESIKYCE